MENNKVISAKEFCKQLDDIHGMSKDVIQSHIDFATLHCKAQLEAILENVEIKDDSLYYQGELVGESEISINKESIINTYNIEENIK